MRNRLRKYLLLQTAAIGLVLFCSGVLVAPAQNVIAWGVNTAGQTNVPAAATNIIAVAGGAAHSLALHDDGTVISWGALTSVDPGASNAIAIAAGASHSLALRSDGTVVAWGDNTQGQTDVPASATNIVAIAAGHNHNLALRADGSVVGWGRNTYGQTDVPTNLGRVIAIGAGAEQSVVMQDGGVVVVFGGANTLPLSQAKNGYAVYPNFVAGLAAGASHNLFLNADGTVLSSGSTSSAFSGATNAVAVAVGTNYNMILKADGRVVAWGSGVVTNVPASVTNVIAVAAGFAHGLAITGDGLPTLVGSPAYHTSALLGEPLPLWARAVGKSVLRYQWLSDGVVVTGETNRLTSGSARLETADVGYQVVVTNTLGATTSSVARVAVRNIAMWRNDFADPHGLRKIPLSLSSNAVIAAGGYHCLGVNPDGTVVAWGRNTSGQASIPGAATNIVSVAVGSEHSLALRMDGTVIAWGRNWDGQTDVPAQATNVVSIAAGWAHSLALRADGSVLAWGNNDSGQTSVSFLAMQAIAISAGYYHSLALRSDGRVVSWGQQESVPDPATNITAISAGWGHSLALRTDGTVLAWGENQYGQCDVPASATNVVSIAAGWFSSVALKRDGTMVAWGGHQFNITNAPSGLSNIVRVAIGEDYAVAQAAVGRPQFQRQVGNIVVGAGGQAILNGGVVGTAPLNFQWLHNGAVLSAATNQNLILGAAQPTDAGSYTLVACDSSGCVTNAPVVLAVNNQPAVLRMVGSWGDYLVGQRSIPNPLASPTDVSAGAFHSLAITGDGGVIAWGKNTSGQTNVPVGLSNVVGIAAGGDHSLALKDDGTVVAWGGNWDGQTNVPSTLTNVSSITAGWAHSLALRTDGTVLAWGNNDYGQTNLPPWLSKVRRVAAGYYHNLAICSDRSVVAWGSDNRVPPEATNVVAISAGREHSLALRADGTVVAWGDNTYGQTTVPPGATNIAAISAGWGISVAVRSDGAVFAWGKSAHGLTNVPVGLQNVAKVSAGEDHILVLTELGPPRFLGAPETEVVHVGGDVVLTASAAGTQPITGQWLHDGIPLGGATDRFLLLKGVQSNAAGIYTFNATNGVGFASVRTIQVVVDDSPNVESRTTYQSARAGNSVCLAAVATGKQPLTYQWLKNGAAVADSIQISGATTPTLCFNKTEYTDDGNYALVVANSSGAATGLVAQLVITPVVVWGDNSMGQQWVSLSATNITKVAAGNNHSVALSADGRVLAWGDNTYRQTEVPTAAANAVDVAAGDNFGLALRMDGKVIGWGFSNAVSTLPSYGANVPATATSMIAIAAGSQHALALRANGTVLAWGLVVSATPAAASNCVAIAAGDSQDLALRADGTIVSWGAGFTIPAAASNVVAIAAGGSHGLALRADGQVVAWGGNSYGQATVPVSASNVVAIAAHGDNSMALRSDGSLVAWGNNSAGQTNVPNFATNCVAIAVGGSHSLALVDDGTPRSSAVPTLAGTVLLGNATNLFGATISGGNASYQWLFNGVSIAGATNPLFSVSGFNWTNAGTYTLVSSNALGTQAHISVTLTASRLPLQFDSTSVQFNPLDGLFQSRLVGAAGIGNVVVLASADLQLWAPIFTNPPVVGELWFTNFITALDPVQFYRAAEMVDSQDISLDLTIDPNVGGDGALLRINGLSASGAVVISASTNLSDWTPIFTNPPTLSPMHFVAPHSTEIPQRFYRVFEQR